MGQEKALVTREEESWDTMVMAQEATAMAAGPEEVATFHAAMVSMMAPMMKEGVG